MAVMAILDDGKPVDLETTTADGTVTFDMSVLDFGKGESVAVWVRVCEDGKRRMVLVREGQPLPEDEDCDDELVAVFPWGGAGTITVDTGAKTVAFEASPVRAEPTATLGADGGFSWYILGKYEFRHFYKWEDVSGDDPSVVTHDATSSSHGAGLYIGAKVGDWPVWAMVGGYYAGGLETNTTLDNGHRIRGEVDQYALGGGLRFLIHPDDVFNPYFWFGGLHTWNKGDFEETNAVAESDHRVLKSWTGEYGIGATYWVRPRVGLDFGLSYNGQFSGENADENVRGSVGMIINGGAVCGGQCGGRR